MNFSLIGSVSSAVKTMMSEIEWMKKKENPFEVKQEDSQMASFHKTLEDVRKGNTIAGIKTRLDTGKPLSSSDLDYLKLHAPELYREAVKVQEERELYKRELEACRSKEEVRKLSESRTMMYVSETHRICNDPILPETAKRDLLEKLNYEVMAVQDEHIKFLQTPEYAVLPESEKEGRKIPKRTTVVYEEIVYLLKRRISEIGLTYDPLGHFSEHRHNKQTFSAKG